MGDPNRATGVALTRTAGRMSGRCSIGDRMASIGPCGLAGLAVRVTRPPSARSGSPPADTSNSLRSVLHRRSAAAFRRYAPLRSRPPAREDVPFTPVASGGTMLAVSLEDLSIPLGGAAAQRRPSIARKASANPSDPRRPCRCDALLTATPVL